MRMQKGAGNGAVPGEVSGGRALYEGGAEQRRAGHSANSYKYTSLDFHIIIITAGLLILLLSIILFHFFIRWALRRLFPLPSKPNAPNKGLTHLQVQALPTYVYPCPFILAHHTFGHQKPTFAYTNCDAALRLTPSPFFVHQMKPTPNGDEALWGTPSPIFGSTSNGDVEKGGLILSCTKLDEALANHNEGDDVHMANGAVANGASPTLGFAKVDEVADHGDVAKGASLTLGCTKVDEVAYHGEVKEVDEMVQGNNPIEVCSAKPNELAKNGKVNASSLTPVINCTEGNKVDAHCELNASSPIPCPICLVDFANGDTIRVLPTCHHYFHVQCVDMWLEKQSSCPACRANLMEATKTPRKKLALQIQVATINTSH
eukprot:c5477_g1_i1 orf=70-1191(+)